MDLKFSFWNLLISYAFEKAVDAVVVGLDLFYSQLPGIDKSLGNKSSRCTVFSRLKKPKSQLLSTQTQKVGLHICKCNTKISEH